MKRLLLALIGCAIGFNSTGQNSSDPQNTILLVNHKVDPDKAEKSTSYSNQEVVNGNVYRIASSRHLNVGQTTESMQVLEYLPKNAFLVSIKANDYSRAAGSVNGSLLTIQPEWKLSKRLFNHNIPDWAWINTHQIKAWVRYYPDLSHGEVMALLHKHNLDVLDKDISNNVIAVALAPEKAMEVCSLPFVMQLQEMEDPGTPENYRARTNHRVNYLQADYPGAPEYDGNGVVVGHGDDGAIDFHVDFSGRLTVNSPPSKGDHGDHVAGTIFGAGNKDPDGRGMAPGAEILYQDYPDNLNDADQNYTTQNVRITSSSYSNGCNAGYTNFTRQMDQDAIDNPSMVHVFSAGNSGSSNCGYGAGFGWGNVTGGHKIAKNVIATANLTAIDGLANSSSRGPASDGRIKPDLGAVGTSVYSTTDLPTPNSYALKTGTSMACPGVSGTMATLYQAYRQANSNQDPHGGLMKAITMNTCEDLGQPGPDFRFGYGRLNARKAAQVVEQGQYITDTISNNGSKTFQIPRPTGTIRNVKIMVYWPDVPASTFAGRALVNDLDMEVSVGSNTYQPWVLDPTPNAINLNSAAVRERDSLNNVEQVTIEDPGSGNISVTVDGYNIPSGPQTFFITYYFEMDDITVTYPVGGEGIDPSGFDYIRWDNPEDNGSFTVEYSADNGTTWNTISSNVNQNNRYMLWSSIPNIATDQAKIRVSRNGISGVSPGTFTILGQAQNLSIPKACPDSLDLAWDSVAGADGYIIYKLGSMYMDSVGYSTTNSVTLANNPTKTDWYSVAATYGNGIAKRAVAIEKSTGTFNCVVTNDLRVNAVLSPKSISELGVYPDCFGNSNLTIQVELENNGLDSIFSYDMNLQLNNGTVVQTTLSDTIAPGTITTYSFPATSSFVSGTNTLNVWSSFTLDQNRYNDTLTYVFDVVQASSVSFPLTEDFENYSNCATTQNCGGTVCPLGSGWINISNVEYDDIDWRVDNGGTPSSGTGPGVDHNPGNSSGKYLYLEASNGCDSSEAILMSPCIYLDSNLTSAAEAEFWYHMNGAAIGILRVDLMMGDTVIRDILPPVVGNQGNQWIKANINLTPYMGKNVVLLIKGKTGNNFTSDIAIDDFGIFNPSVTPPSADFSISDSSECTNVPLTFTDLSTGNVSSYIWDFGPGATPSSAMGAGPHTVSYTSGGTKTISLRTSNAGGSNSKLFNILIEAEPVSNFVHSVSLNTAFFLDQSQNSPQTWLWTFGDGDSSTAQSPQHTYINAGTYEVTLTTTNNCGSHVYKDSVEITTGVGLQEALMAAISIYPNPNNGNFVIELPSQVSGKVQIDVVDITGKVILSQTDKATGQRELDFDISSFADGVYIVKITSEQGTRNFRLVKKR